MVNKRDFLNARLQKFWSSRYGRSCPAEVMDAQSLRVYLLWDFGDDEYMSDKWRDAAAYLFFILKMNKNIFPQNMAVTRVVTPLGTMNIEEYNTLIKNKLTKKYNKMMCFYEKCAM